MKLRGDLEVTREINSLRSNEALAAESLSGNRAITRYDSAWLSLNPNALDREVELPDATTLPNGWKVVIQHDGAADSLNVRQYDGLFGGTILKSIAVPVAARETGAYEFVLLDNGTAAGDWYVIELGDPAQAAAAKFVATFTSGDFPAAVAGRSELTSSQIAGLGASTHGRGANPVYIIQELDGTDYDRVLVDRERMNSSGDLAIRVTNNDEFNGRVVFI